MPKVAKQHGEPEAAMVAALGGDQIEIVAAQRAVPDDLPLFCRRSEQPRPLFIREQLSNAQPSATAQDPYMIVYDPETNPIGVARVLHASQDLESLFRQRPPSV
jgi:plasmid stabilization system protein ParE